MIIKFKNITDHEWLPKGEDIINIFTNNEMELSEESKNKLIDKLEELRNSDDILTKIQVKFTIEFEDKELNVYIIRNADKTRYNSALIIPELLSGDMSIIDCSNN
jgi:hypothetical protein